MVNLMKLVGTIGLEPTTPTMSRWCSNQLSYVPAAMQQAAILADCGAWPQTRSISHRSAAFDCLLRSRSARSEIDLSFGTSPLNLVLTQLRNEGVWVDDKRDESEFGKFGWIKDCDGNRVELWELPKDNPDCS